MTTPRIRAQDPLPSFTPRPRNDRSDVPAPSRWTRAAWYKLFADNVKVFADNVAMFAVTGAIGGIILGTVGVISLSGNLLIIGGLFAIALLTWRLTSFYLNRTQNIDVKREGILKQLDQVKKTFNALEDLERGLETFEEACRSIIEDKDQLWIFIFKNELLPAKEFESLYKARMEGKSVNMMEVINTYEYFMQIRGEHAPGIYQFDSPPKFRGKWQEETKALSCIQILNKYDLVKLKEWCILESEEQTKLETLNNQYRRGGEEIPINLQYKAFREVFYSKKS